MYSELCAVCVQCCAASDALSLVQAFSVVSVILWLSLSCSFHHFAAIVAVSLKANCDASIFVDGLGARGTERTSWLFCLVSFSEFGDLLLFVNTLYTVFKRAVVFDVWS